MFLLNQYLSYQVEPVSLSQISTTQINVKAAPSKSMPTANTDLSTQVIIELHIWAF
jgi:hypothetical protein